MNEALLLTAGIIVLVLLVTAFSWFLFVRKVNREYGALKTPGKAEPTIEDMSAEIAAPDEAASSAPPEETTESEPPGNPIAVEDDEAHLEATAAEQPAEVTEAAEASEAAAPDSPPALKETEASESTETVETTEAEESTEAVKDETDPSPAPREPDPRFEQALRAFEQELKAGHFSRLDVFEAHERATREPGARPGVRSEFFTRVVGKALEARDEFEILLCDEDRKRFVEFHSQYLDDVSTEADGQAREELLRGHLGMLPELRPRPDTGASAE